MSTKKQKSYLLAKLIAVLSFFLPVFGVAKSAYATASCGSPTACLKASPITHDINLIVNFLSAGVAVVVVGVIILGGIQYSMAGDKPEAVAAAKQRIINGFIALAIFMFTFAFLQWLIPGGVFS